MGLSHEHELHRRRRGRNIGIGLVLAAFIALVFALTVAKFGVDDIQDARAAAAGAQAK